MPDIALEILMAGVREVVFRVLDLKPEDGPQRRQFKLSMAAWALDRAGVLPRAGIATVLGKSPSWVSFAVAATERRIDAHRGFRLHAKKTVEAMTAALNPRAPRRV